MTAAETIQLSLLETQVFQQWDIRAIRPQTLQIEAMRRYEIYLMTVSHHRELVIIDTYL